MSDEDDPTWGGYHSRMGDPDTSIIAVPTNITEQARKVLYAYRHGHRLLDHEAYALVRMIGHQRCSDLRRAKYIMRVDKKTMPSGKPGYRCQITQAGLDYLKASLEKVLQ